MSVAALARSSEISEGVGGTMTYLTSVVLLRSGYLCGSMKSSSTKRRPVARPLISSWARRPRSTSACSAARSETSKLAPFSSVIEPRLSSHRTAASGLAGGAVVADRDADDVAHAHAAQLDRRALVQAADRLVEVDHEALRLREEAQAAEREERDDPDRERAQDKGADDGGADLGFHVVRGWLGAAYPDRIGPACQKFYDLRVRRARRRAPRARPRR